jgi:hypothetical protein
MNRYRVSGVDAKDVPVLKDGFLVLLPLEVLVASLEMARLLVLGEATTSAGKRQGDHQKDQPVMGGW